MKLITGHDYIAVMDEDDYRVFASHLKSKSYDWVQMPSKNGELIEFQKSAICCVTATEE